MNRRLLAVVGAVLVLVVVYFSFDLGRFFSLEYLRQSQAGFAALYAQQPARVVAVFFAIYVAVTAFSLPGATIMTLAAGAIFGVAVGTVVVSFASSIGATLAFLAARYVLGEAVRARFAARLADVDRGVAKDGAYYLFTLRLVPLLPFFVVNLLMGLTKMKAGTFYIVSQVGMLAATVVYVNAGTQLAQLQTLRGVLSPGLLGSFVLLGVFPLAAKWAVDAWRARRVYARWAAVKPKRFDRNLLVIGGGAAGLVSAYIAAAVRAKVTLVEGHKLGGDCLNYGCVPSKALIKTATLMQHIRHAGRHGIAVDAPKLDFAAAMARVHQVIRDIEPHDSAERYRGLGVDVVQGHATLVSPWEVRIALADGGTQTLTSRAIVIATGAAPFVPPLPGLAEVGYLTSDTLWGLRELPPRLLVLGGGPIGCELAQCFARLGSQVTQVEMGATLLAREDAEVSALARAALERDGVSVLTGHRALRCELQGTGDSARRFLVAEAGSAAGAGQGGGSREVRIEFDRLLCAVGRAARLEGFGLAELGIPSGRTIECDEYLQTIYPNILAAGDVAGPFQFTHTAAHQAWYAAVNGLFGSFKRFKADYSVIPWATFISPEVARVGLSEAEAAAQGVAFEVARYPLHELDRAIADGETEGFVKVLTVPGKDRILGVTIVGTHAADLLAEYVLAMKQGIGLNKILGTIHTYPTLAEANKYAAGEWKRAHQPLRLLAWVERLHAWRRG